MSMNDDQCFSYHRWSEVVDANVALDEVCNPLGLGGHSTPLDHLVLFAAEFQQLDSVLYVWEQWHMWRGWQRGSTLTWFCKRLGGVADMKVGKAVSWLGCVSVGTVIDLKVVMEDMKIGERGEWEWWWKIWRELKEDRENTKGKVVG